MQNLIVFQAVRNPYRQVGSERRKKLKNTENLIFVDEYTVHKIKIFPMKNWWSEYKRKRTRCRI